MTCSPGVGPVWFPFHLVFAATPFVLGGGLSLGDLGAGNDLPEVGAGMAPGVMGGGMSAVMACVSGKVFPVTDAGCAGCVAVGGPAAGD